MSSRSSTAAYECCSPPRSETASRSFGSPSTSFSLAAQPAVKPDGPPTTTTMSATAGCAPEACASTPAIGVGLRSGAFLSSVSATASPPSSLARSRTRATKPPTHAHISSSAPPAARACELTAMPLSTGESSPRWARSALPTMSASVGRFTPCVRIHEPSCGTSYRIEARGEQKANCATNGRKMAPSEQHMRSVVCMLSSRPRQTSATPPQPAQRHGPRPAQSRNTPGLRWPSSPRWSFACSR
mmetsp:Transcript_33304/g.82986  ORF Transcript_33304/g.82986 Transcript_33304/m.82986 type:complete len:243 (-) Transcript_33304:122-850(-)